MTHIIANDPPYNCLGNNATDITAGLNAALAAAAAAGRGLVQLRPGGYVQSGPIVIDGDNVQLEGLGGAGAVFLRNTVPSNSVQIGNASVQRKNIALRGIGIEGVQSGGYGILAQNLVDSDIVDFKIRYVHNGIGLFNCAFIGLGIEPSYISELKPGAGIGVYIDGGNDHYPTRIAIDNPEEAQPECGFKIAATGGTWFNTCGAIHCGTGFLFQPYGGRTVEHIFSVESHADKCSGDGWHFNPLEGSTVHRMESTQDWAGSCGGSGVKTSGPGIVSTIEWSQFRSFYNGKHGFEWLIGEDLDISRSKILGNSRSAPGQYDGVYVGANLSHFSIYKSRIRPAANFPNWQRRAVTVETGSSDHYDVSGNDFVGNLGPWFDGGSGVNKVVSPNFN